MATDQWFDRWEWRRWFSDTQLQAASMSTQGVWLNLLGRMWERDTAELTLTAAQFAKLVGATEAEFSLFLEEADDLGFCDIKRDASRIHHAKITVISRRRKKQEKNRENSRLRSARYRASRKRHGTEDQNTEDQRSEKKENPPSEGKRKKAARAASSPAKPAPPPPVYPPELNVKAWELYVQHRRQLKKNPFTDLAAERAMKKLIELGQGSPSIQQAVVDQTLENNWVGLVALKEENHHERRNVSPIRPADASEYTPDGKIRSH